MSLRSACRRLSSMCPRTPCGRHPIVDVSPLLTVSPVSSCTPAGLRALEARRDDAARHIGDALFSHGYFYASGVETLPESYIAGIYEYSRRAHALPAAAKSPYRQRGGLGTYSGPDVGQPELNYDASDVPATVRGWDYSRSRFSLAKSTAQEPSSDPVSDPRYPPASVLSPPFGAVLDELYARQDVLARALLGGFERALGLPDRTLLSMFDGDGAVGDFGTIRLLLYPGSGADAAGDRRSAGIAPHTDFECFTLMHQDAPGLQLMPRAANGRHGAWVDAPVRAEFIVIIGDALERLTNGMCRHARARRVRCGHPACISHVSPMYLPCISLGRPRPRLPDSLAPHAPARAWRGGPGLGTVSERPGHPALSRDVGGFPYRFPHLSVACAGKLLATPHRVLETSHERASIIRFNAFAPEVVVAPHERFVSADQPARYSAVTMRTHMETTMTNLEAGLGSWDPLQQRSLSATYDYSTPHEA